MHVRIGALACACFLLLAACGDDSSDSTSGTAATAGAAQTPADQGPNPTTDDPGPNDTSDGPETIQGILVLDTDAACVAIDVDGDLLAPTFVDYRYAELGDGAALVDDEGTPTAHDGDAIIVAGRRATDTAPAGPCGPTFEVESLVNVTPTG